MTRHRDLNGRLHATKDNCCDELRLHVRLFFENYTFGETTTGQVEKYL